MEASIALLEEIAVPSRLMLKDMRDNPRTVCDRQEADFRILFAGTIAVALAAPA